jgi:TPR repeat protein
VSSGIWKRLLVAAFAVTIAGCSDYQTARRAYEVGKFTEALTILERLADAGEARAQYEVALMYLQGIGTKVDPLRGGQWMLAAANNGNVTAMVEIGGRFENGVNAEKNLILAFTWYRRAALAGDGIGCYKLAMLYEVGSGVPQDLPRAYAWYRMAGSTAGKIAAQRVNQIMTPLDRERGDLLYDILKKNPEG